MSDDAPAGLAFPGGSAADLWADDAFAYAFADEDLETPGGRAEAAAVDRDLRDPLGHRQSQAAAPAEPEASKNINDRAAAAAGALAAGIAFQEVGEYYFGSMAGPWVADDIIATLLQASTVVQPEAPAVLLASALTLATLSMGAEAFASGANVTAALPREVQAALSSQRNLLEAFEDIKEYVWERSAGTLQDRLADLAKGEVQADNLGSIFARHVAAAGVDLGHQAARARRRGPAGAGPEQGEGGEHMGIAANLGCARRVKKGWRLRLQAHLFYTNGGRHSTLLKLARKLLFQGMLGIGEIDSAALATYEERARLILRSLEVPLVGDRTAQALEYRVASTTRTGLDRSGPWRPLPPTDAFGSVEEEIELTDQDLHLVDRMRGSVTLEVRTRCEANMDLFTERGRRTWTTLCGQAPVLGRAVARLVEEEGLSVISDIDDTVKVTEVFRGKGALLRNTFLRRFRAVDGMANLYRRWASDHGAVFQYVSKSPPELHGPLCDFLQEERFPVASVHLCSLFSRERGNFKKTQIERIFADFPRRRFVLVGDSGEHDPQIYADLLRRHPGQVEKVLIREVDPSMPVDTASVFGGLPAARWQVFRDPVEIRLPQQEEEEQKKPWRFRWPWNAAEPTQQAAASPRAQAAQAWAAVA